MGPHYACICKGLIMAAKQSMSEDVTLFLVFLFFYVLNGHLSSDYFSCYLITGKFFHIEVALVFIILLRPFRIAVAINFIKEAQYKYSSYLFGQHES